MHFLMRSDCSCDYLWIARMMAVNTTTHIHTLSDTYTNQIAPFGVEGLLDLCA